MCRGCGGVPSGDPGASAFRQPLTGERPALRTAAFGERVAKALPEFRRGLRRRLRVAEAEEIEGTALLRAVRYRSSYDEIRPLGPWLARVGANVHRDHRRREELEAKTLERLREATCGEVELDPAELFDRQSFSTECERAIGVLDPLSARCLLLRELNKLTTPEIAAEIGSSVAATASRLHRARAAFSRAYLQGCDDSSTEPLAFAGATRALSEAFSRAGGLTVPLAERVEQLERMFAFALGLVLRLLK